MSDTIQIVIDALKAKHGKEAARKMSDGARSAVTDVIPTGILPLDNWVTGCGGLPVGRVTELFSEEGGGKTSLVYQCIGQCQKMGGISILVETEDALDPLRAEVFGVNLENLVLIEPNNMEEALEQINTAISALPEGVGPILLAWDSLAATPTKAEIEAGLVGGNAMADRARLMSRACRVLGNIVSKHKIAMLIVNQTRTKMGIMFGDNMTTPGGQGLKFLSSLRLKISGGKANKNDLGDHTAKDILFHAVKNRMAPPWRKCRVRLDYETGFDNEWTVIDFGKERKILKPRSRGKKAYDEVIEALGWKTSTDHAKGDE